MLKFELKMDIMDQAPKRLHLLEREKMTHVHCAGVAALTTVAQNKSEQHTFNTKVHT